MFKTVCWASHYFWLAHSTEVKRLEFERWRCRPMAQRQRPVGNATNQVQLCSRLRRTSRL